MKRSNSLAFAAGFVLTISAVATPAKAGGNVFLDHGKGTINAIGTAAGAEINMTGPPAQSGTIFSVNNGTLPTPFTLGLAENIIGSGGKVTGGTGTKAISYDGKTVLLHWAITSGSYSSTSITDVGTIFSVTGTMGTVLDGYNFASLMNGHIALDVTLGTAVVGVPGATSYGDKFTLSEGAVPEPSTMALLGIGMTGLLAFRRYFNRAKSA